ncbi:MAG: flagellar hook-basal body complex protein FliE [Phycisphaeraceae bacterium]
MSDPLGLVSTPGIAAVRPMQSIQPMDPSGASGASSGPSFKDVLMDHIEQVNHLQQDAQHAIEDLAAGRRDDYSSVMMAKQKADLAFQMLVQVRNKMVAAYDEIKQMRV